MATTIQSLPIPGAPDEQLQHAYRLALVEVARARTALAVERRQPHKPSTHESQWLHASAELEAIRCTGLIPLEQLVDALELTGLQRHVLALAAASFLEPTIDRFLHSLGKGGGLDKALALEICCADRADAFRQGAALHQDDELALAGLIEYVSPTGNLADSPLDVLIRPTPRLMGLLYGSVVVDPRVLAVAQLRQADDAMGAVMIDAPQTGLDMELLVAALHSPGAARANHVALVADDALAVDRVALALGRRLGHAIVLTVDATALPMDMAQRRAALSRCVREAENLSALLHVEHAHAITVDAARALQCPAVLTSSTPIVTERTAFFATVPAPNAATRAVLWLAAAAVAGMQLDEQTARALAHGYQASVAEIGRAVAVAATLQRKPDTDVLHRAIAATGATVIDGAIAIDDATSTPFSPADETLVPPRRDSVATCAHD